MSVIGLEVEIREGIMCSFCVVIINGVACKEAFVDDEQETGEEMRESTFDN